MVWQRRTHRFAMEVSMSVRTYIVLASIVAIAAVASAYDRHTGSNALAATAQASDVERLVAVYEIEMLKARYGRMTDAMDASGLRDEVFAPDVVMDVEWP